MLGKLLLMRDSGLLPFCFEQDEIELDDVLLSGFCMANYNIAKELHDSIDMMLMKEHYKILFEEFYHTNGEKFIMACICNKYHIDEGVKKKMGFIFNSIFNEHDFSNTTLVINDPEIKNKVKRIMNDGYLQDMVDDNVDLIDFLMESICNKKENEIYGAILASSTNNILYSKAKEEITKYRSNQTVKEIMEEYLTVWNVKKIPQGDIYQGFELIAGLDLVNFTHTNEKMYGLGINTSINSKEEPSNELILYLFGKNTLMRQCVINIEEILRDKLLITNIIE